MWFRIERKQGGIITIAYKPRLMDGDGAVPQPLTEEQAIAIRDLLDMAIKAWSFTMEIASEG